MTPPPHSGGVALTGVTLLSSPGLTGHCTAARRRARHPNPGTSLPHNSQPEHHPGSRNVDRVSCALIATSPARSQAGTPGVASGFTLVIRERMLVGRSATTG
ncbi:hypothetical protein [Deinococcus enclensis]|uniref:Secreted protein n=1 Tax=Deinococcus enclensis TaxID=1049582 RepID=A0ABT9MGB8_9DEIO|nr:hypothetical protein [Deinococcus enclensis]MDP9765254.1 hypothetical protein [Deinococcus enclensis]